MKVLIVDNHPVVVSACRALFAQDDDVDVIEAHTVSQAEALYASAKPDVAIVDINLPDGSGLDLTRRLVAHDSLARILVFTMCDDPMFAAESIDVGARGFLTKNADPLELRDAVYKIAASGIALSPEVTQGVALIRAGIAHKDTHSVLSEREIAILRHLASGLTMAEVGGRMNLSYKTVAKSCARMRTAIGVRNQLELLQKAVSNGYLS